jgi:Rrf2 family transcriptional regulator, nitric oxide-sensitive transcriptional repressor
LPVSNTNRRTLQPSFTVVHPALRGLKSHSLISTPIGIEYTAQFVNHAFIEGFIVISKTAEYALRAVVCLAAHGAGCLSADELSEATKVPRRYLNRVLQNLVAGEVVQSRSGPGGGYSLCVDPKTLTILDILNAVAPLERIRTCPLGIPSHQELCPLHAELDRAYEVIEKAFSKISMEKLIRSSSRVVPLCE